MRCGAISGRWAAPAKARPVSAPVRATPGRGASWGAPRRPMGAPFPGANRAFSEGCGTISGRARRGAAPRTRGLSAAAKPQATSGPPTILTTRVTPGRSARPSHAARRPAGSAGRLGCGSDGVGHLGSPLTSGRTNIEHHPALGKKLSASGVRPPGLLGTARTRERRLTRDRRPISFRESAFQLGYPQTTQLQRMLSPSPLPRVPGIKDFRHSNAAAWAPDRACPKGPPSIADVDRVHRTMITPNWIFPKQMFEKIWRSDHAGGARFAS